MLLAMLHSADLGGLWTLLREPSTAVWVWPLAGLGLFALGWTIFESTVGERRRRRELELLAPRLGGEWRPRKRYLVDQPFGLFRRGERRWSRHHLSKALPEGVPGLGEARLDLFEYSYLEPSGAHSKRGATRYEFTCAVVHTGVSLPWVQLTPQTFGESLRQAFGGGDIDLEDAEFSRGYRVAAESRRAAFRTVGPGWMRLLVERPGWTVESAGTALLVRRSGFPRARDYRELLDLASALAAHLPRELVNEERRRRGLGPCLEAGDASPAARTLLERVRSGLPATRRAPAPCDFETFRAGRA